MSIYTILKPTLRTLHIISVNPIILKHWGLSLKETFSNWVTMGLGDNLWLRFLSLNGAESNITCLIGVLWRWKNLIIVKCLDCSECHTLKVTMMIHSLRNVVLPSLLTRASSLTWFKDFIGLSFPKHKMRTLENNEFCHSMIAWDSGSD